MSIEFLTAIALWCGQPHVHLGMQLLDTTKGDIDQCRSELLACVEKASSELAPAGKVKECFKKQKQP